MSALYGSESIIFKTDDLKKNSDFKNTLEPIIGRLVESGMIQPISYNVYSSIVFNLITKYILPEIKNHKIDIIRYCELDESSIPTYIIKSVDDVQYQDYSSIIFDPPEVSIPTKTIIKEIIRCL